MRDGTLRCRRGVLLPVSLAALIFEILVPAKGTVRQWEAQRYKSNYFRPLSTLDQMLAFEAAVAVLDLKTSEVFAGCPFLYGMLFERMRRQRFDLAFLLYSRHYRIKSRLESRMIAKIKNWKKLYNAGPRFYPDSSGDSPRSNSLVEFFN